VARQIFRAIKTTIGLIGTENASCIAITALDLLGVAVNTSLSRQADTVHPNPFSGSIFLAKIAQADWCPVFRYFREPVTLGCITFFATYSPT
jgi:hypothetical protein